MLEFRNQSKGFIVYRLTDTKNGYMDIDKYVKGPIAFDTIERVLELFCEVDKDSVSSVDRIKSIFLLFDPEKDAVAPSEYILN